MAPARHVTVKFAFCHKSVYRGTDKEAIYGTCVGAARLGRIPVPYLPLCEKLVETEWSDGLLP